MGLQLETPLCTTYLLCHRQLVCPFSGSDLTFAAKRMKRPPSVILTLPSFKPLMTRPKLQLNFQSSQNQPAL